MPRYQIIEYVERASGRVVYEVEADSPEEARRLYDQGDAKCTDEELEVEKVGDVEVLEMEEE